MPYFPLLNTEKAAGFTTVHNFSPNNWENLGDVQERMSIGRYLTPFFYLSILLCLCVGVFSYEILYLLTPREFHAAAPIISILCLLCGFYFFGKQPQLLYAKKTGLISILSLVSISLNVVLNIPLIHYFGIMGAAIVTTLAGIVSTAISFYFGQKYTKITYEDNIWFLFLYFIMAVVYVSVFLSDELSIINFGLKILIVIVYIFLGTKIKIIGNELPKSIFKISK